MEEVPLLLEGLFTKLTVFLPLTNSDSWKLKIFEIAVIVIFYFLFFIFYFLFFNFLFFIFYEYPVSSTRLGQLELIY